MGSVRLEPKIEEKVRRVAAIKGITLSDIHRMALEQFCDREIAGSSQRKSRYADVIGIGASESEGDLSSRHKSVFLDILNKKYPSDKPCE